MKARDEWGGAIYEISEEEQERIGRDPRYAPHDPECMRRYGFRCNGNCWQRALLFGLPAGRAPR